MGTSDDEDETIRLRCSRCEQMHTLRADPDATEFHRGVLKCANCESIVLQYAGRRRFNLEAE